MDSSAADAQEAQSSSASYHHRSPNLSTSSSPPGFTTAHRHSKRTLSNAAAAALHVTADVRSSTSIIDGQSNSRCPSEASLSVTSGASSSSTTAAAAIASDRSSSSAVALIDHHRSQGMGASPEDGQLATCSSNGSLFSVVATSSAVRVDNGSISTSMSYQVVDDLRNPNHSQLSHHRGQQERSHPHLAHHAQQHDEDHGEMTNYHTSPLLSQQGRPLPDMLDCRSLVAGQPSTVAMGDSEPVGHLSCGQKRPDRSVAGVQYDAINSVDGPITPNGTADQREAGSYAAIKAFTAMEATSSMDKCHILGTALSRPTDRTLPPSTPQTPSMIVSASLSNATKSVSPGNWSEWPLPHHRAPSGARLLYGSRKRVSSVSQSRTSGTAPHRSAQCDDWKSVIVDDRFAESPTPCQSSDQISAHPSSGRHHKGHLERKRRLSSAHPISRSTSSQLPHSNREVFLLQPVPSCKRRRIRGGTPRHPYDRPSFPHPSCPQMSATQVDKLSQTQRGSKSPLAPTPSTEESPEMSISADEVHPRRLKHHKMITEGSASHSLAHAATLQERTSAGVHLVKGVVPSSVTDNLFNVAGARGTAFSQVRCTPLAAMYARGQKVSEAASPYPGTTVAPRGRQALPTPIVKSQAPSALKCQSPIPPQISSPTRLLLRPRRRQSVPNMRAKAMVEGLEQRVDHQLMMPAHLSSMRFSLQCSGASTGHGHSAAQSGLPVRMPAFHALPSSKSSRQCEEHLKRHREAGQRQNVYTPPLHPPITRHTLRELDLSEILKNPQLRHDVVFDANVQFRPNFDGERGRKKKDACEKYWTAVTREIELGCCCTSFEGQHLLPCVCIGTVAGSVAGRSGAANTTSRSSSSRHSSSAQRRGPSRVPILVQELRAICLSILPRGSGSLPSPNPLSSATSSLMMARGSSHPTHYSGGESDFFEHSLLSSRLDPMLISQQLSHGVLDVAGLITFVASVLQLHCAPMRDETIELMVKETNRGHVGKGLRMCFEILELMKLDIANHQLRSARPYLIETAVEFEARWFRDQIEGNRLVLDCTKSWFSSSWSIVVSESRPQTASSRTAMISKAFHEGFMRLVFEPSETDFNSRPLLSRTGGLLALPSSPLHRSCSVAYPETFQFDAFRLMTFHNDAIDLTVVYMLLMLFRQLSCSPAIAGRAPTSTTCTARCQIAAALATKRLDRMKAEIWCLLNEANAAMTRRNTSDEGSEEDVTSTIAASSSGRKKLIDPRWRGAMKDCVLQVAARARAVWEEASTGSPLSASNGKAINPSAGTIAMLESWLETNLSAQSALMKLCLGRVKGVLALLVAQRMTGGGGSHGIAASISTGRDLRRKRGAEEEDLSMPQSKKHKAGQAAAAAAAAVVSLQNVEKDDQGDSCKEAGDQCPLVPSPGFSNTSSSTAEEDWSTSLTKVGLEPLRSELYLLGTGMSQVASVNLRTFRVLYEKLAA